MSKPLFTSLASFVLLAAPAGAQQLELTTTNNVSRHQAPGCFLQADDQKWNICNQFAITKGKDFVGYWFENQQETHGYGFLIPSGTLPDNEGDLLVTHIVVMAGDHKYDYQGMGLCRITHNNVTACTFNPTNIKVQFSAGATHAVIR